MYADASQPLTVAVVPAEGGEARTIRELPTRYPLDLHVVPEAVTLEADDGFEFYNQLFLPPDLRPGEKRPAMIFIHGGSRRQMLLGYHYMHFYHMAYAMNQYFANKGYVVLSVNYRSGIGYGREFRTRRGGGGWVTPSTATSRPPASTCATGPTWIRTGSGSGGCRTAGF